ncbi:MAG: PHP domain-containing protein [Oscillospiraceae bacterium]|nr:PHP domain-containing protein [Oscillospiraceae bacterium]
MKVSYDLHVHSCLSPCCDDESTPANIAALAALVGLDVVALSDHNTSKNCPAFFAAAEQAGIVPIAGMELSTVEEIHLLCLFPQLEKAMNFDEYVSKRLFPIKNEPKIYGNQYIMDSDDNITGVVETGLIHATSIEIYEVERLMKEFGGVFVPSHIDRDAFSIISSLGTVPHDCGFKTVEIYSKEKVDELKRLYPFINNCKIIHNSDAHMLEKISLPVNKLTVKERTAVAVLEWLSE